MSTDTVVERVRALAAPIVADLGLEVYDLEMVSGVLRLSIDTPPGQPAGVTLENIALVSRLVSRELDHNDPVPGRYTLEVSSPGLERPLRTPQHFVREVNKVISVRLHQAVDGRRRMQGVLLRADERGIVVCLDDTGTEVAVAHSDIERARTVFVWGSGGKDTSSLNHQTAIDNQTKEVAS
ncbi:MAG: ribosome maturation factor RimP [Actinomycetota bacterium]